MCTFLLFFLQSSCNKGLLDLLIFISSTWLPLSHDVARTGKIFAMMHSTLFQ